MFWAVTMRRAAYDPETISTLSSVLERAIAALPRKQRTEDGKARLASSTLIGAAHLSISSATNLAKYSGPLRQE
jgi:hypothetical protein